MVLVSFVKFTRLWRSMGAVSRTFMVFETAAASSCFRARTSAD